MADQQGTKKQRSSTADGGTAVVVDRISDLHDDLLLHVLSFLPDARDLVQTAAVSRRWRHLWTRAPVLRFESTSDDHPGKVEDNARFFDLIDAALARRTEPIDRLTVSVCCDCGSEAREWPSRSRINLWLDLAMRHAVTSLDFTASPPWKLEVFISRKQDAVFRRKHRLLLPDRTRATEVSLCLHEGALRIPSTAAFHDLTHLSLSSISFQDDDDDDRLGRFLSSPSCCPRLRKLRLSYLKIEKLRLDCSTLEILELDNLGYPITQLDVNAPRLSVLAVEEFVPERDCVFTVAAPALKELRCCVSLGCHYSPVRFQWHTSVVVLERCTSVDRHALGFHLPEDVDVKEVVGKKDVNAFADPYLPQQLPCVRDLTLALRSGHTHNFIAIAARFVARCSNLQHLRLHIPAVDPSVTKRCGDDGVCCGCDLPERWLQEDDDMVISLEHLREVEMRGLFSGRDCHDMAQLLLAAAPALQRMIIVLAHADDEEEDDGETPLPHVDRGEWTVTNPHRQYEWTLAARFDGIRSPPVTHT